MAIERAIVGCILGTAVGDALGLPYEGLSPARAHKLLGPPERYRFVFGRGMISDDTEHTCMVSQSLIESGDNVEKFTRRFASRLRWWILALPAGVGKATARSCIKLWLGIHPWCSATVSVGSVLRILEASRFSNQRMFTEFALSIRVNKQCSDDTDHHAD